MNDWRGLCLKMIAHNSVIVLVQLICVETFTLLYSTGINYILIEIYFQNDERYTKQLSYRG